MKQKKLIAAVGAAVVLGFGGATAQAADNFTGPYVGGSLMLFNNTTNETNLDVDGFVTTTDGFKKLGADDSFSQLDLVLGYGMLLDNRVYLGAEARYTLVDNFKDDFFGLRVDDNSLDFGIEGDGGYALMLQAGYAVTDNVVLYGTAGYVKREWDLVTSILDGEGADSRDGFKSSGVGYGMGVKYALNRNFIVNAEVLKTNFSSKTPLDSEFSIEPDSVSVSLGVAYRF